MKKLEVFKCIIQPQIFNPKQLKLMSLYYSNLHTVGCSMCNIHNRIMYTTELQIQMFPEEETVIWMLHIQIRVKLV
jgi:hypothetical protein